MSGFCCRDKEAPLTFHFYVNATSFDTLALLVEFLSLQAEIKIKSAPAECATCMFTDDKET